MTLMDIRPGLARCITLNEQRLNEPYYQIPEVFSAPDYRSYGDKEGRAPSTPCLDWYKLPSCRRAGACSCRRNSHKLPACVAFPSGGRWHGEAVTDEVDKIRTNIRRAILAKVARRQA